MEQRVPEKVLFSIIYMISLSSCRRKNVIMWKWMNPFCLLMKQNWKKWVRSFLLQLVVGFNLKLQFQISFFLEHKMLLMWIALASLTTKTFYNQSSILIININLLKIRRKLNLLLPSITNHWTLIEVHRLKNWCNKLENSLAYGINLSKAKALVSLWQMPQDKQIFNRFYLPN